MSKKAVTLQMTRAPPFENAPIENLMHQMFPSETYEDHETPSHYSSGPNLVTRFQTKSLQQLRSLFGKSIEHSLVVTTSLEHNKWFLGIFGSDPRVSKSNRLYIDMFRFSFINLRCILETPLNGSVLFLKSWWTSTGYFSNSTSSSATKRPVLPVHWTAIT